MRRLLLPALAACSISLGSIWAADEPIPKPMAMPDESGYAVAIMPDMFKTFERIEAVANLFEPGAMPPGAMKQQFGTMLGDEGLANFTGKPVIVVVGPGAPTPSFALLVPATDPQKYLDAGVNFGMLLGKAVGDIAVLTQTPDGEILGEKVAKAYAQLTADLPKADARILVAPDKLLKTYGGMLGMMTQMMAAQGGPPEAAKILGLEVAGLMAVGDEISAIQMDISLDPKGIVSEDVIVQAKEGSKLANALVAPPEVAGQHAAARLSDQASLMCAKGRINVTAFSNYFADLMTTLKAKPEAEGIINDDLIAAVKQYGEAFSGDMAFTMRNGEGAMPLQWEALYSSNDAAKAEQVILKLIEQMRGDSGLGKMYADMGVTMKLEKAARTSPSGVSVHKVSAEIDETKMPAQQAAQMKLMSSYELAMTKGWVVMAQDSTSLDALIAGTGKGKAVAAEEKIGSGRQVYADIDILGFSKAIMKLAGTGMEGMIPESKPEDFVNLAGTANDGKFRMEMRWSLIPFVDMAKAFRGGGRRGGRGNQQPPPDQDPAF